MVSEVDLSIHGINPEVYRKIIMNIFALMLRNKKMKTTILDIKEI